MTATDKTIVLITGANRGIGFSIASALLNSARTGQGQQNGAPYHVILTSRSADKGKEAVSKLTSSASQHDSTVSALELDVTNTESIRRAVSQVQAEFGRIDVLINNAGVVVRLDDPVQALKTTLETNTTAPFAVTEGFKALLKTQPSAGKKEKRMIVVSSDLGSLGLKADQSYKHHKLPAIPYRMSKAAIDMMVLSYHIHETDFKSFVWSPGYTATGLTGDEEERRKQGANDPDVVAGLFVSLVNGTKDADAGKLLDEDLNVLPW